MYTFTIENKYGESLELTHNSAYDVVSILGLDPPDATINTSHNAGQDGTIFNSSFVGERTITLTLAINSPAETNRINLFRYFKSKQYVKCYYTNRSRNVNIIGYVQSINIAYFDKKETAQINIKCPAGFFQGTEINTQDFSSINPLFEFPFSIEAAGIPFAEIILNLEKSIINYGDVETGVLIEIHMLGSVHNPKIFNVDTSEYFIINGSFVSGDVITINTRKGEKEVTLLSAGVTSNLIGSIQSGSSWFQLLPADNVFTVAADAGAEYMDVTFTMIDLYEGV